MSACWSNYSVPVGKWDVVRSVSASLSVCLSVSGSVCTRILGTTIPNFTSFTLHLVRGRRSVFL